VKITLIKDSAQLPSKLPQRASSLSITTKMTKFSWFLNPRIYKLITPMVKTTDSSSEMMDTQALTWTKMTTNLENLICLKQQWKEVLQKEIKALDQGLRLKEKWVHLILFEVTTRLRISSCNRLWISWSSKQIEITTCLIIKTTWLSLMSMIIVQSRVICEDKKPNRAIDPSHLEKIRNKINATSALSPL
jgi:hypothetical protein